MALPSGYTQLQYIESTGTQYINTGFVPNQDTRAVCDAQFTDISGTVTILGQRYTSAAQKSFTWISVSGNLRSYYHSYYGVVATSDKLRHVYELDKNKTIIDGNTVSTRSYVSFTADFPIFIFANNEQGTASFHAKMKLYACQIYNNGTLVRDYVPCMSDAEGVGLYDLVNNRFYGNDGTGTFVAGSANPNPTKEYTELEYIQSNGSQYIDTGFKPNQNTRVVMDAEPIGSPSSKTAYFLFCGRTSGTSNSFGFFWYDKWGADFQTSSKRKYFSQSFAERLVIDFNKTTCTVNGNSATFADATFQAPVPLALLAANTNGTISGYISAKLYSCKIYDNGTLVRDYVPAMRNADGAIGLYDQKNGVFYTNAGSGAFEHGGPVGPAGSRVLIDGVDYRMKRGIGLVGGVLYGIKRGKVMESGAVYDILLDPAAAEPNMLTVTIEVEGGTPIDSVTINGVSYNTAQTITVEPGTVATFKLHWALFENGNQLYYYTGSTYGTYAYTINTDIRIKFMYASHTYIYR